MQHSHEALDRPGGLARVATLAPLRHRDFRLLWAGMTISLLGDGLEVEAVAHRDDRAREAGFRVLLREERPVHFQDVDGEPAQVREGRVTGAEIVHR